MNAPIQARFFRIFAHILFLLGVVAVLFLTSLPVQAQQTQLLLASKSISLENRYPNKMVSNVFKDNILLTISYLSDKQDKAKAPKWDEVEKPFTYDFTLKSGERFAFHDTTMPLYAQNVVKTTNAHYNGAEGFKSDGYLMGDGVCHLASLFYWAAKDAGLSAVAPVNHDFAVIPEISKEYGVAIYSDPANPGVSAQQNLYISNNLDVPVTFHIAYNGKDLSVKVLKQI